MVGFLEEYGVGNGRGRNEDFRASMNFLVGGGGYYYLFIYLAKGLGLECNYR